MFLSQNVALVMVNTFVKFDEINLTFVKVMAEICWKKETFTEWPYIEKWPRPLAAMFFNEIKFFEEF